MLDNLLEMFSSKNSNIKRYVDATPSLAIENEAKKIFIKISRTITKKELSELLEKLWKHKFELAFHDTIHPTISDPGAYFSYSTEKTIGKDYWSMSYGNHGWSGGIYHLKKETVTQQVYNLIDKGALDSIQITAVHFFSNYDLMHKDKSTEKDKEIYAMHTGNKN